ncbi:MAG: hypothetical protein EOP54_01565 [Sphingobacteriales bacterium]|nr:MAG: hypothetical protein EOP54_01565 [Sphingobacteriales bacterium]
MYIHPIYSWSFVLISILLTYFFVKRMEAKGCITFAYVGAVIFCINLFALFSWMFMWTSCRDIYNVVSSGKQYTASVISYTSEEHYDSEDRRYYTMRKPTVQFRTESGAVIRKPLSFSKSSLEVGDTYKVNYNAATGEVITLGFIMIIKFAGSFIFCFILTFLVAGMIRYIIGWPMERYYTLISKIGFNFFVPLLMISFDALLIYALFYGNDIPGWATAILVFFIIVLTLAVWGYIKMIFSKGTPVMRRTGPGQWSGDREEKKKSGKRKKRSRDTNLDRL